MSSEAPIRVLRVIARLNVGGPALHVTHLSSGLVDRGYETTLVAGRVGAGEGSMEHYAYEHGVQPLFLDQLRRDLEPMADAAAVAELVRLIRETRPHILHTHTAKAGAVGRVAALAAGAEKPPVVVHTFHGHVLRGYFPPLLTQVFRGIEAGLARTSDALIAVSPQVRDDLASLGVAARDRIAVVRLGLELEDRVRVEPAEVRALRAELGLADDDFVIGWLGRMTAIKRVDDLLRAFAQVRRDLPAKLLLAGDGPLKGALERIAARLGVVDDVCFAGFRTEVAPVYAASDVIALSSANEGTPVTLIEASAAGRPVVSTDVGGVADIVRNGETGFLVRPGDVGTFARRLAELASDKTLRRTLGEAGREWTRGRYSVPRLLDDVDALYRSLLLQKRPRTHRVVGPLSCPLRPALPDPTPPLARAQRRLRIVLVSQYFPPEVGATQTRIQSFADHLAARGHHVTVVCEVPNHPHGVVPACFRRKVVVVDRSNAYRVVRVGVLASPEKTPRTRMAFYLSYMATAVAATPVVGRADVVVATSPPLFAGLAGYAISRLLGTRFVLDVRDLWPAAAVSLKQVGEGASLKLALALERFLYREADVVTAVTAPFCRHVDEIRGRSPSTELIPNGTLDIFFETPPPQPRDGRLHVMFAGTHGIAQALPSVLDAAALTTDVADYTFVGDGPIKHSLVADAAARALPNVAFEPQVALDAIPARLADADALLVPLSAHPTFADFVPSKVTDFMAAARPVIVSAAGEVAALVERAGAGVVAPPEDPVALADAVRWLAANPAAAGEMAERGRAYARKLTRRAQAERLEALLLDLTRSPA